MKKVINLFKELDSWDRVGTIVFIFLTICFFGGMLLGRLIYYNDGEYWKQELLQQYNQLPLERNRVIKEDFKLQPERVNYKLRGSLQYAENTEYMIDIIDRYYETQGYVVNKSADNYQNDINHKVEHKGYIIRYTSVNRDGKHLIVVSMRPTETYNFPARFNW